MEAIFGILNNPLALLAVGYVVTYVPGLRTFVPQRLIPFLNLLIAWLSNAFAPTAAHAYGGPMHVEPAIIMATFGLSWLGSFGAGLAAAVSQTAQAYLLHRVFGRQFAPPTPPDSAH